MPKNNFKLQWAEFDKNDRAVIKEKEFVTRAVQDRFEAKLQHKDNFWKVTNRMIAIN